MLGRWMAAAGVAYAAGTGIAAWAGVLVGLIAAAAIWTGLILVATR